MATCNILKPRISVWPKGQPNTAYAQYFIGNSYLAPIAPANLPEGSATVAHYANVTFEPGCRNNWHIHYGAHQILICVSGRGWCAVNLPKSQCTLFQPTIHLPALGIF